MKQASFIPHTWDCELSDNTDKNLSAKSISSILQAIGNTPLVKLEKIVPNKHVTLLVKCEFTNPSGSVKDRIVDYIIADAEQKGLLKPGGTIVENTSEILALLSPC